MAFEKVGHDVLKSHQERFHRELYESVLPFWMKHSLDRENGGYYNCLDRDGRIYDTKKHVWLQGRQVWMLSKIHNTHHKPGEESEWLEAAKLGADFLRSKAREGNRVYFSLQADGGPVYMQRKMFSECFYAMAMAEYGRASGDESALAESLEMLRIVEGYAKDPSLIGRPVYPNQTPTSDLAVPMILLNMIDEIVEPESTEFNELKEWCVRQMSLHVRPELNLVLEHVGADGKLIDSPEGRLVNPGHALEAGWFLMAYARKSGKEALVKTCLNMIDWSFDFGWDEKYNGIFYFLDSDGFSPVQLEWSQKLWWPHCEAMIAFLMAFQATGDNRYFQKFEHVMEYSFSHFADPEHGEWFGYLDRHGEVNQRFKGGPYKGCFHVPRALYVCEKLLGEMLAEK